jgi:hypothetical protein
MPSSFEFSKVNAAEFADVQRLDHQHYVIAFIFLINLHKYFYHVRSWNYSAGFWRVSRDYFY